MDVGDTSRVGAGGVGGPEEAVGAGPGAASVSMVMLLRCKWRMLCNGVRATFHESPMKVVSTALFVGMVWIGLFLLFHEVFRQLQRFTFERIIAMPMIFQFFFVALMLMLTLSNVIVAYGGLFGKDESGYLLSSPVDPMHIVGTKYLESLFISSWSLILLGLPLMVALSRVTHEAWYFYPAFTAFFLAFVPIPAAVGLTAAWAAAMWFPRSRWRVLTVLGAVAAAGGAWWGYQAFGDSTTNAEAWLKQMYRRMDLIQAAVLPSTWVSSGIDYLARDRVKEAGFYLAVTAGNAVFLSWWAVVLVSRYFASAYGRAQSAGDQARRNGLGIWAWTAQMLFWYLPRPLRLIAAKDFRTFWRDPLQWLQLLILFGLLALYILNIPRISSPLESSDWQLLVSFLNVSAVSLILATFTSRFVFPMVSLEGQQLWLVGLLPFHRHRLLAAKFAFALTVTLTAAMAVMGLSVRVLHVEGWLAWVQIGMVGSSCIGLCGLAVGTGARWPMFAERNPARIANGMGGTLNLIGSVGLVTVMIAAVGLVNLRIKQVGLVAAWNEGAGILVGVAMCAGPIIAGLAMWWGGQHFRRADV